MKEIRREVLTYFNALLCNNDITTECYAMLTSVCVRIICRNMRNGLSQSDSTRRGTLKRKRKK